MGSKGYHDIPSGHILILGRRETYRKKLYGGIKMREQNIIRLEAMENGVEDLEFMDFDDFILDIEDDTWDDEEELGIRLEDLRAIPAVTPKKTIWERITQFSRTVQSIHHWSVWLARWGGRKFSVKDYLESFFRLSKERFMEEFICKRYGHKWTTHPDEPGFSTCSRCRRSDLD